jgi:2',3'-cyclic-nucleotide 2'-phosphodiesterase (5'-nucleotidase family)
MYKVSIFGFFTVLFFACTPAKIPLTVSYQGYRVNPQVAADSGLQNMLAPYAATVNSTMNKVIGFANSTLTKRMPDNELGNFMTDCFQKMGAAKFGKKVHIAFMNQGGIRADINKGNITIGNIYELMPFDNLLILQDLKGDILEQLIQHNATDGGWPISAGSSYMIKDKKAINIIIDGKPLDKNVTYTVASSDYIANGGSNAIMLKAIPQQNKGYLLRDALIEYVEEITKAGRPIEALREKRVTKANE